MNFASSAQTRLRQRALLLATAAPPLTGWALHAIALHRRLATSRRDPLTGLLRRDAYTHTARQILRRHGDDTAVIMVDQENNFKHINDGLGHATRDAVVRSTAARLTQWAGPRAAVGGLGGDEFALVLHLPRGLRETDLVQLVQLLHTQVVVDDLAVDDTVVATPDVIGTRDLSALHRAADAALYDGKLRARGPCNQAPHHCAVHQRPPRGPPGHG